jgi:hypothetical protein
MNLPRKVNETNMNTKTEVLEQKARLPIMPKDRTVNGQRNKSITIVKPDLANERYFNSKHTTPNVSRQVTGKVPQQVQVKSNA